MRSSLKVNWGCFSVGLFFLSKFKWFFSLGFVFRNWYAILVHNDFLHLNVDLGLFFFGFPKPAQITSFPRRSASIFGDLWSLFPIFDLQDFTPLAAHLPQQGGGILYKPLTAHWTKFWHHIHLIFQLVDDVFFLSWRYIQFSCWELESLVI